MRIRWGRWLPIDVFWVYALGLVGGHHDGGWVARLRASWSLPQAESLAKLVGSIFSPVGTKYT